jgi:FixJ family two-component response regulator
MIHSTRTVFVVDDAIEVRVGLARILATENYEARVFESAERFLELQDVDAPGCLLLDIYMPGLSGFDLQRSLLDSLCGRPIVFLTGHGDIHASVHAMKAGAVDFLTKPIDKDRLFAAIDRALELDAAQRQVRAACGMIGQRLAQLTPRERQVMEHVVHGRLNKQIAASLGTGEKTIKVHRARMMWKMGARSVAELVQLGSRVGVAMTPTLRSLPRFPPGQHGD